MAKLPHTKLVALDHISCAVRDLKAARKFYGAALGAIGMKINLDFSSAFGLGSRDENIFWLHPATEKHLAARTTRFASTTAKRSTPFSAPPGLAASSKDNGKPGPRPDYGRATTPRSSKTKGNNLEVVCYARPRRPPPPANAVRGAGESPQCEPGLWTSRCATSAASPGATRLSRSFRNSSLKASSSASVASSRSAKTFRALLDRMSSSSFK